VLFLWLRFHSPSQLFVFWRWVVYRWLALLFFLSPLLSSCFVRTYLVPLVTRFLSFSSFLVPLLLPQEGQVFGEELDAVAMMKYVVVSSKYLLRRKRPT